MQSTSTSRISLGLSLLLLSVMLIAQLASLAPDKSRVAWNAVAELAETVAIKSSSLVRGKPVDLLQETLLLLALLLATATYYRFVRRALERHDPSRVVPARVRDALDALASGLIILDSQQRIVLANRAFASVLRKTPTQLRGKEVKSFPWLTAAEDWPWTLALSTGQPQLGRTVVLNVDPRQPVSYIVNAIPLHGEDKKLRGLLVSLEDITPLERKKKELGEMLEILRRSRDEASQKNRELKFLATRDPLTGCLNRRSFFERFETQWNSASRYDRPLSCIMIDLDYFKPINDTHGHSMGDAVLKQVAKTLLAAARKSDEVCRFGGEEFCLLLPQTDLHSAAEVAERTRLAIAALKFPGFTISASLGVSALCQGAADQQSLVDQADRCLYAAKRSGRNRVVRWDQISADLVINHATLPHARLPVDSDEQDGDALQIPVNESAPAEAIPYGLVAALLSALAYRDGATADHSRRVADLCVSVGRGLMTAHQTYVLEMAALLHDIGKIGVPDSILLKPGPLTRAEWQAMAHHVRIGVEIVNTTFGNQALAEIIRSHHACFAGDGDRTDLPSGQALPLGARILTIADAYDAMTFDRVYRPGRSREAAFAELRRCAGVQFDPELVEQFIEVVSAESPREATEATVSRQAAVRIGSQIERLACAMDSQDLTGIATLAARLHHLTAQEGLGEIANLAQGLEDAAGNEDLLQTVRLTNELFDICRDIQGIHLGARELPSS